MSRASWPRTAGASCVFSTAIVVAAEAWPKPSPQPSSPWSVTMRSQTVFIVCQLRPPIVAGLPPMSNGMRVQ